MNILEKARKILDRSICDHCLGRQFGQLLSGLTNADRGKLIRSAFALSLDKEKLDDEDRKLEISNFGGIKFHNLQEDFPDQKKCVICNDIFKELDKIAGDAAKKAKKFDFKTFLIGTKLSADLLDKEEELWEDAGIEWAEPLKAEINREIGKRVEDLTGADFDKKRPQMNIVVNFGTGQVDVSLNPLFIYGEYQKLVRGIPQTRWPTKKYTTSVEQIIAKPFMAASKGSGHKFHGLGREDIDARCLAWRPFVLEISEPKKRDLDFAKLGKKVNAKVKVKGMRISSMEEVRKIKATKVDKTYRALIVCKKPIKKTVLAELKQLVGEIKQRTPIRVVHRRADRVRKRKLKEIKAKFINSKRFEIVVRGESGLYIKELVSGDKGRTEPNVSGILDAPCQVKELDVIKIHLR